MIYQVRCSFPVGEISEINGRKCFFHDITHAKFKSVLALVSCSKWDFRVMGGSMAFLKSKSLDREIYVSPPLFPGNDPSGRWKLLTPLYGHAPACKE